MTSQPSRLGHAKPWPKVHLIYFLLAAFDIMAIAGGLYLSHQYGLVFKTSVRESEAWDRRTELVLRLAELSGELSRPANEVFTSREVAQERNRFGYLVQGFHQLEAEFLVDAMSRASLDTVRPVFLALNDVPAQIAQVSYDTRQVLALYETGDFAAAANVVTRMNGTTESLRQNMYVAAVEIQKVRAGLNRLYGSSIENYRVYEYLIGGAIVFIVTMVTIYGFWVGRLMKRKYGELEAAHGELSEAHAKSVDDAREIAKINESVSALNVQLAENMRRLQEAQDEIVRKGRMAQLGQLTATVAHELRNPLGAVRTSIFLLDRKIKGKGLGVEQQIERINNGVTRCDGIITQLLDFARSKALHVETAEFDAWLAKTVEEEAEKLPTAVEIELVLGLGELKASFDPARFNRVIVNLMSNASEAMVGKGDDPSKFATAQPRILIESRRTARGIEVSVIDNGPGISEENLRKILEPLFTTKSFGTGLGLPAVEKILDQHGGGLEVSSKQGEGARFTAWLPFKPAASEAA